MRKNKAIKKRRRGQNPTSRNGARPSSLHPAVTQYRCLTCGRQEPFHGRTDHCRNCGGYAFLIGHLQPPEVEVHLRKLTVDDAMFKLDRYINTAFIAGLLQVRIVHGKGAGLVKTAAIEYMTASPLVRSFRPATVEEGGGGVTIATLALDNHKERLP